MRRIATVDYGELEVNPKTGEVVNDFTQASLRMDDINDDDNEQVVDDENVIIPRTSRYMFINANDEEKEMIIKAVSSHTKNVLSRKNEEYTYWFKNHTMEGQMGADPYKHQNHYNYADYFKNVVKGDPTAEEVRLSAGEDMDESYMNDTHPMRANVITKDEGVPADPNLDPTINPKFFLK